MSGRIERRAQAKTDLIEHGLYISEDNPAAADRFLRAAEADFAKLADMPGMGGRFELVNPILQGLRKWPIRGFENYLIFYLPRDHGIEVIRVLHGARDLRPLLEANR